jgi:hypothetical protein
MKSFSEFLGRKDRQVKERLQVLGKIFTNAGFRASNHTDDNDPYIFVWKPTEADAILESLSFEGVRIYIRGKDNICYRVANKETTEPFGNTYALDVKGMFHDMLRETHNKEKIGHEIIRYLIAELKTFFIKSAEAEKELPDTAKDSKMGAVVGGTAGDWSNSASSPNNSKV